jgi:hypothetical protein
MHLLKAPIGGFFLHVKVMIVRMRFVFFESSKNVKVFLLELLALVKKLLDSAKKENEDILIQKIDLEKVQFELQTLTQTLEGGMLNRKKSL